MAFGDVVRAMRLARHWKQVELARRSGIDQGTISGIENNKYPNPTRETIIRLARAFEVTTDALLQEPERADTGQPPVELLRAAGYSEELITQLVESWDRQPEGFRSEVVARAQRHVQAAQEEEDRLRALLRTAAHIL